MFKIDEAFACGENVVAISRQDCIKITDICFRPYDRDCQIPEDDKVDNFHLGNLGENSHCAITLEDGRTEELLLIDTMLFQRVRDAFPNWVKDHDIFIPKNSERDAFNRFNVITFYLFGNDDGKAIDFIPYLIDLGRSELYTGKQQF